MNWREVLFISMIWWTLGAAYLLWPQSMFRFRLLPFGPSEDGLTESGELAYKRLGIFLILLGVAIAVLGLTI